MTRRFGTGEAMIETMKRLRLIRKIKVIGLDLMNIERTYRETENEKR
jgi:hypothetical protein